MLNNPMKSAQQLAESAARAIRKSHFPSLHESYDDDIARIILRETGLEGLVECEAALRVIVLAEFGRLDHPQIKDSRMWQNAANALSKLSPPEA